eukprot:SAG11_NODE_24647_length_370_cov_0.760148_1_plen_83_part_10
MHLGHQRTKRSRQRFARVLQRRQLQCCDCCLVSELHLGALQENLHASLLESTYVRVIEGTDLSDPDPIDGATRDNIYYTAATT